MNEKRTNESGRGGRESRGRGGRPRGRGRGRGRFNHYNNRTTEFQKPRHLKNRPFKRNAPPSMQMYPPVDFSVPPPPFPQRPPSLYPGTEEYRQKNIQETSELIKRQLQLDGASAEDFPAFESGLHEIQEKNDEVLETEKEGHCANAVPPSAKKSKMRRFKNVDEDDCDVEEIYNKIIKHISKLSNSKKINFVHRGLTGYDVAVQKLQLQKRLELSRAFRDMANKDSSDCEVINSIIPDFGIKIEDLPRQVIFKLSSTLGIELKNEKTAADAGELEIWGDNDGNHFNSPHNNFASNEFNETESGNYLNEIITGNDYNPDSYDNNENAGIRHVEGFDNESAGLDFHPEQCGNNENYNDEFNYSMRENSVRGRGNRETFIRSKRNPRPLSTDLPSLVRQEAAVFKGRTFSSSSEDEDVLDDLINNGHNSSSDESETSTPHLSSSFILACRNVIDTSAESQPNETYTNIGEVESEQAATRGKEDDSEKEIIRNADEAELSQSEERGAGLKENGVGASQSNNNEFHRVNIAEKPSYPLIKVRPVEDMVSKTPPTNSKGKILKLKRFEENVQTNCDRNEQIPPNNQVESGSKRQIPSVINNQQQLRIQPFNNTSQFTNPVTQIRTKHFNTEVENATHSSGPFINTSQFMNPVTQIRSEHFDSDVENAKHSSGRAMVLQQNEVKLTKVEKNRLKRKRRAANRAAEGRRISVKMKRKLKRREADRSEFSSISDNTDDDFGTEHASSVPETSTRDAACQCVEPKVQTSSSECQTERALIINERKRERRRMLLERIKEIDEQMNDLTRIKRDLFEELLVSDDDDVVVEIIPARKRRFNSSVLYVDNRSKKTQHGSNSKFARNEEISGIDSRKSTPTERATRETNHNEMVEFRDERISPYGNYGANFVHNRNEVEMSGQESWDFRDWEGSILVIEVKNNMVLSGNDRGVCYVHDLHGGRLLEKFQLGDKPVTSICCSDGNDKIYVGTFESRLCTIDTLAKRVTMSVDLDENPVQCMDRCWGYFFIGSMTGNLLRFNISRGKIEDSVPVSMNSVLVVKAVQEGARRVVLIATRNSAIMVRDAMSGLLMRHMQCTSTPTIYSLLFHDNRVYCGTSQQDILVYTFQNGEFSSKYTEGNTSGVISMKIVRNVLFSCCYNGNIYAYNTRTNKFIASIEGPSGLFLSMSATENEVIIGTKQNNFKALKIPQCIRNEMI